jgi:hypothetical protein
MVMRRILAEIPQLLGVGRSVDEISESLDINRAVFSFAGEYFFDSGHRMTSNEYNKVKQYNIPRSRIYRLF